MTRPVSDRALTGVSAARIYSRLVCPVRPAQTEERSARDLLDGTGPPATGIALRADFNRPRCFNAVIRQTLPAATFYDPAASRRHRGDRGDDAVTRVGGDPVGGDPAGPAGNWPRVHTFAHAAGALTTAAARAGRPITFSPAPPPDAGIYAGPGWFRAPRRCGARGCPTTARFSTLPRLRRPARRGAGRDPRSGRRCDLHRPPETSPAGSPTSRRSAGCALSASARPRPRPG